MERLVWAAHGEILESKAGELRNWSVLNILLA